MKGKRRHLGLQAVIYSRQNPVLEYLCAEQIAQVLEESGKDGIWMASLITQVRKVRTCSRSVVPAFLVLLIKNNNAVVFFFFFFVFSY